MTSQPTWTPASRPGIIPLHPLSFGTILGRSFSALRQNPKVLLGFALIVQTVVYVVLILGIGGIAFASFSRLDTLQPGSDDFEAVLAGSVAITAISGFVMGLAATALSVIVQAVVVSEVAHAIVAEKLTLSALWARVKPVVWRLIGYSLLVSLVVLGAFAVVGGAIFALAFAAPVVAIILGVLVLLLSIPLSLWLSTKLALVPSVILLERATIRAAVVRSWILIRGRFWPALGVLVVISVIMTTIAQVVSVPFSLLSSAVTTIISPTGDPTPSEFVGVIFTAAISQIVVLLIQSVAIVVQATAAALIYVDCRMRREGLDLDLLSYIEQRDAGAAAPRDPYAVNVGRVLARAPWGQQPAPYAPQGYPPAMAGYAPPPAPQGYAPAAPAYAPAPQGYAPPPQSHAQGNVPVSPDAEAPPVAPPAPPATPPATSWAAPGTGAEDPDRG